MSFIQFRQHCLDCKEEWNTAFGMQGMTMAWEPPIECPSCKSKNIEKSRDGWGPPQKPDELSTGLDLQK